MTRSTLVTRSLVHYWRTNLAVVAGVATAVSVLAGALVVGDSVRGTLRTLAFARLGAATSLVASSGFFREALARDLADNPSFASSFSRLTPLIVTRGTVTVQGGEGRAGNVAVYGVDRRFWQFHGLDDTVQGPDDREAFVSPALGRALGIDAGGIALVRVERASDVPLESLHGRKEGSGLTIESTVRQVLPRESLGEFSLEMRQGDVLAVFLPLERLQVELEIGARVNAILVSRSTDADRDVLERLVRSRMTIDDIGLRVRPLEARHAVSVDSNAGVLAPASATAAAAALEAGGLRPRPVLTYLANRIRIGDRAVPYSLVTATDLAEIAPALAPSASDTPPIVLNTWAATDLGAHVGDTVTLDYYVWTDPGALATRSATFRLAAVVPVRSEDRDLAPAYPGITDSPTLDSWDPPFPIDLRQVRPKDEAYWQRYRTTPKAYIPIAAGQQLWASRFGRVTSLRAAVPAERPLDVVTTESADRLRARLDPFTAGMFVRDLRDDATKAAAGTTDFGEYFLYFSFFLVVSALLLAALFFKFGVEQRAREVGLLRAVGINAAGVHRLFQAEALLVSIAGTIFGLAGAVGFASLVIAGLRTWWFGAVGTRALALHVTPVSLAAGALGGLGAAVLCTWWTLRGLARISERSLLAGDLTPTSVTTRRPGHVLAAAVTAAAVGAGLVIAASLGAMPQAAAFFGAGSALLVSALCTYAYAYRASVPRMLHGRGVAAIVRLGLRHAAAHPGRSVLTVAIIGAATFIVIAVDAFRRDVPDAGDPHSGTGGYSLVVETLLPIVHDVSTSAGRAALNLGDIGSSGIQPFRLRAGDDASCLNLYRPQNPRILGARDDFLAAGRFTFQATVASTGAERTNPWLLLDRRYPDEAVPVAADANSMTYVLHKSIGEDIVIDHGGRAVRLRIVAALADSIFQSELVMAESRFLEVFPDEEGYRVLLVDAQGDQVGRTKALLEQGLADFGADVRSTAATLAAFHQVENTYLSTFQALGGLGLFLGTVGLAALLSRNVLERRRELALLGAVGYRRSHFVLLLVTESASLLAAGLVAGALSASLAIWPAVTSRGGLPVSGRGVALLVLVFGAGVITTMAAARVMTRGPVLAGLRSE